MGGHYSGQIQPTKETHLVRIRKISNGLMAVTDGRFMSLKPFDKEKKQEGYLGFWKKADLPTTP